MKKCLFFIIAALVSKGLDAQDWVNKMQNQNLNFYDIRQAFNNYWDTTDKTVKSRGYKVFKRWEYMVEPRVYPSGNLNLLNTNALNFQAFLNTYQISNSTNNNSGPSKQLSQSTNTIASTTWSLVGPMGAMTGSAVNGLPRKAGRDNFITFLPGNSNTYWVGAPVGGLWKTTNNGTTWATNTDNLNVIGCTDLAVDPTNTNVMYLGTGDGYAGDCPSIGVLKTTNGGTTWNTTGLTFSVSNGFLIRRILIHPTGTQTLLAATNGGVYRSTNGGTNWTQVSNINAFDLEFKPGDPNTVYATGNSFYLSTNAGITFTQISSGIPTSGSNRMNIAVTSHSSGASHVYVVASNSSNSGLLGFYRSTNSGVTFTAMTTTLNLLANACSGSGTGGQGWYDLAIAASPLDPNEVVVGGINHWRTTNGGSSWTCIGCWNSTIANPPYVHADVHDLEYTPAGVLYSTNDGGVYSYTGSSWTDRTGTRNIAQIYRIGLSSTTQNYWITGHQDNGSNIYNGTTYNASYPGDGLDCFVDRTNNNTIYTETPNGGLVRSTNGGSSWSNITSGLSGNANWLTPMKQDPQNANTIYCGLNTVWTSTNQGNAWTSLSALSTTANGITEFAIAPSSNQVIYVLKNSGVWRTANGGASWTNVTGTIPIGSAAPTYVAISSTNPNVAWVTLSGYSNGNKIFKTINGGTSWSNVSSNLPNLPANCVVYEPGANDRIYVGMDVGVYYLDNSTSNWTLYNTSLPNTVVSDLEISPAFPQRLRAATYGRGVYQVDVPCNITPSLAVSNQTICSGGSATLTVAGAHTYTWSNNSTATAIVVSPTTTTLYSVNAYTAGCSTTATISVVVNNNLSINVNTLSLCTGNAGTLQASGATNYTWSNGATTSSFVVTPTASTVYSILASNGACTGTAATNVTVTSAPSISLSTPSSNSICSGYSFVCGLTGACNYTTNPGNIVGNSLILSPLSTTIYTVTGSCVSGCVGSRTLGITILSLPSVSASASSPSICFGGTVILSGSGANTYSWSNGAVNNVPASPSVTTNYSVIGFNSAGCSNTAAVMVSVVSSASVSVNNQTICSGGAATLVASGASSYSWNTGSTASAIVVSPSVTTVYTVTGSNGSCSNTKTVSVSLSGSLNISVNSVSVCAGSSAILTASGASSYTWSTGGLSSTVAVSPTTTSVYTVTGSNGSCTGAKTTTVNVLTLPIISYSSSCGFVQCSSNISCSLSPAGACTYTYMPGIINGTFMPVNNQSYTITGTSCNGCVGAPVTTPAFTVFATPTINIAASSPTVCSGANVTLTASGANTYSWSNGASGTSIVVSPTANVSYNVTGVTSNSCTGSSSFSLQVTPSNFLSVNNQTICSGGTVTLSALGATGYTWSTGALTSSIVVSPSSNMVYTVTGDNSGCINTRTVSVTVGSGLSLQVNASAASICSGSSATLTASGASNYTWSTGSTNVSIVVNPSSTTVYSVSGTNGSCNGNTIVTISVTPQPTISLNVSPSATLCAGSTATINAGGAASYTWNTGSNSSFIVVTPTANAVFVVNGGNAGCTGSQSIALSVGAGSLTLAASANPQVICAGGSATLTAMGAGTYTWSNGSNNPVIVVSPAVNTTYTVSGTNSGCSGSTVVSVAIGSGPVSVVSTTNAGCANSCSGIINVSTSGGNGPYTYSLSGSTCTALPCTNLCPGVYNLFTFDSQGCSTFNLFSIASSQNNLLANISGSNATCGTCGNGLLMANPSGGSAPYTYTWIPSGGNAATAVSLTPGCYTVNISDAGGCNTSAKACVGITTALGDVVLDGNLISVFPNPAGKKVTVSCDCDLSYTIKMYNGLGQMVAEYFSLASSTEISVEPYARGIYMLEILSGQSVVRKKLVLE